MLHSIQSFIRKYFGFSRTEANGFIVLIPLLVILVLSPTFLKQILLYNGQDENEEDVVLLSEWANELKQSLQQKKEVSKNVQSFDFDPNTCTVSTLEELGFSKVTTQRIDRYRKAGGKFFKKEGLLKIYGISETRVKALWNHIKIPKPKKRDFKKYKTNTRPYKKTKKRPKIWTKMALNNAPADSIRKVRGIGPVLSERIVKYRNRLGGFTDVNQLSEVYGLKEDVLDNLWQYFELDTAQLKLIKVNVASDTVLRQHPYISWSQARAIVAYRNQHGPFDNLKDLSKIKIINDSIALRLRPYLSFD